MERFFESKLPGEVHLGVGVRVVEEAGMDHQVPPHWWLDQNQVRAGWHLIAWVEVQMQPQKINLVADTTLELQGLKSLLPRLERESAAA